MWTILLDVVGLFKTNTIFIWAFYYVFCLKEKPWKRCKNYVNGFEKDANVIKLSKY